MKIHTESLTILDFPLLLSNKGEVFSKLKYSLHYTFLYKKINVPLNFFLVMCTYKTMLFL